MHLLRQEAASHVERARHEAQQTRSAAEAEVLRLRQEAIQEISSRHQTILQRSKTVDTLGSENLLLSQRLADLERAVASMAQNVPAPPDESHEMQVKILQIPGFRGKMSLDVTSRLNHRLPKFKGLVMPHVSSKCSSRRIG